MSTPKPLVATAWVVVAAKRSGYGRRADGSYPVESIRLSQLRASKPPVSADEEAVEITITFPHDYFDEVNPKVNIVVPSPPPKQAPPVTATVKGRSPSAAASIINGSTTP